MLSLWKSILKIGDFLTGGAFFLRPTVHRKHQFRSIFMQSTAATATNSLMSKHLHLVIVPAGNQFISKSFTSRDGSPQVRWPFYRGVQYGCHPPLLLRVKHRWRWWFPIRRRGEPANAGHCSLLPHAFAEGGGGVMMATAGSHLKTKPCILKRSRCPPQAGQSPGQYQ
jgi:hypothetical protein